MTPKWIRGCPRRDSGAQPCCFSALWPRASPCPAPWCSSFCPSSWQEVPGDGVPRYPFPQGPRLFHQKSHRLPGSGQTCILSSSHLKTGTFLSPKPFPPRRADDGLLICGDEKDTNEEILIQAKGSFFLFYVQIMQHNCFTVINIISGASQTAFTMQISRLQKSNQEESGGCSAP